MSHWTFQGAPSPTPGREQVNVIAGPSGAKARASPYAMAFVLLMAKGSGLMGWGLLPMWRICGPVATGPPTERRLGTR